MLAAYPKETDMTHHFGDEITQHRSGRDPQNSDTRNQPHYREKEKFMKKKVMALMAVATAAALTIGGGLVGCDNGSASEEKVYDKDVIYVGNTVSTTGAFATVGVPFNIGVNAALKAYNDDGGFGGKNVQLKHYDDGGDASASATYMEKLIHEDEIFAVVGNFYGPSIEANLPIIKDSHTPMVYAAAGNDVLVNEHATDFGDRCVMPVQPTYITEGRMLLLRAFAPAMNSNEVTGAIGGQKVGVITVTTDEGSNGMKKGIDAEKANLTDAQKANITEVNISSSDGYTAAIATLKNAGCDTVVAAVTQASFVAIQAAMKAANYYANIITSYNNASTSQVDAEFVANTTAAGKAIYAQSWINIYDTYDATNGWSYYYKGELWDYYKGVAAALGTPTLYDNGVFMYSEEYWGIAEDIYDYCVSANIAALDAFNYSYNSYALAGYVAGDMFTQGLAELEKSDKELTQKNFVDIMESKDYHVSMGNSISFADGSGYTAQSATICDLVSIDFYRDLIK